MINVLVGLVSFEISLLSLHVATFFVDLPNPGIKLGSLVSPALAGRFFTAVPPGSPGTFSKM